MFDEENKIVWGGWGGIESKREIDRGESRAREKERRERERVGVRKTLAQEIHVYI